MVSSPRCVECDAPVGHPSQLPCWRCDRAWEWLAEKQDERLLVGWEKFVQHLRDAVEPDELVLNGLRIVAWQNRVLTIAGWVRYRRWFQRRYVELTKALLATDKDPVLVTPRVGATIARRIQREEQS